MNTQTRQSDLNDIKTTVSIAEYAKQQGFQLKKHGKNDLKMLCPFHDDKNPSLIITPDKNLFNCPVCHTGGSVIDFAMKLHNLTLSETIKKLSSAQPIANVSLSASSSADNETLLPSAEEGTSSARGLGTASPRF